MTQYKRSMFFYIVNNKFNIHRQQQLNVQQLHDEEHGWKNEKKFLIWTEQKEMLI